MARRREESLAHQQPHPLTRGKRGRPKAERPMVLVTLRLPQDVFDTYCHRGHRLRVPLQRVLRGVLIAGARPQPAPKRAE